jgi:hypothetical protein
MTNYVRSIRLVDVNGANLAEILMPDSVKDEPSLLMPTMGMYFAAQENHSQPFVRTGPHRMHWRSFLAYLAGIAAAAPDDSRLSLVLEGAGPDGQYQNVLLARTMQADDLTAVTGIPLDDVREFLANHLSFGNYCTCTPEQAAAGPCGKEVKP